jgi:hypothetical protein
MKQTNVTNYSFTVGEGAEKKLKNFSESRWQSFIEAETEDGGEAPVPEKVQTFVVYEAETPTDFAELVPNEAVSVSLWNRGASLKQLTEIRQLMESGDFISSESPYDLREALNSVTERRSASPEDRVASLLDKLPEDAIARIMEKLMERQTQPK